MTEIEPFILRILKDKEQIIGTGFLVSSTLAVTCAHVVLAAGLDGENRVRVQFAGQKQPVLATALDEFLDLDRDIAILRLESVPEGIQPLRLGLAEHSRAGNAFRSFGYATAAGMQGIFANGSIDGYLRQHKLVQLQSPQANYGMSGAPVLDEQRGVVIGMITKGHTELGRNENTTFATPTELLLEICPQIQISTDVLNNAENAQQGAIAQGNGATSIGEDGIGVAGNLDGTLIKGEQNQIFRNSTVILAGDGAHILVGEHATAHDSKPDAPAAANFALTTTSILTFLFTDIEGSTQLWENHPEAMRLTLARHDAILREAVENHKGRVFKTVGDAFYCAFPNTRNALKAALAAQRALHAEAWGETLIKVRMALHTGNVESRDNDYFGPPLNRVARLMAAGHGGQVLLSTACAELVRSNLPPGAELRDMGERRLKDLTRPEHIYQLLVPDLPADFPPLKTLDAFRTNLPAQLTSFIGRGKEIATVKQLVAKNRLTTLTGAGGAGKTRLSLQAASELLDSFPDGVWFVEFAPLSDPALIPQTVMTTIGLREENARSPLEILSAYLHQKKALLLLDNCEHLVEASAQLAEALLQTCSHLRILVSSREALDIDGETAYRVPSLAIPNIRHLPPAEMLAQYEAARLFIERAQTALPAFAVTKENAPAIAKICSRLDGIPLAIELAAARVKMLKAEQIAERLDDRFRLLTGGSRTALPRHQTLRAMIDWSYDLLPESERVLLHRLSVFAGGWTLEAAETVCQGPGIDDYNVLDPLAQLVNKSLVVVDADENTETRYRLLETVRQYAQEKLSETGEGMAVRDAHLHYFLNLAERAEPELAGPRVAEWIKWLEAELDNIYGAMEWSLKSQSAIGLQLITVLSGFFREIGYNYIAYKWLILFLNQPQTQTPISVYARALCKQAFLSTFNEFERDARPIAEKSLAIYRNLKNKQGIAENLLYLGIFAFHLGEVAQGRKQVIESLAIYRELGDKTGMAEALAYLGSTIDTDSYQKIRTYLDEGLAICREVGNLVGMSRILSDLGNWAIKYKEYAFASSQLEESLVIQRKLGKGNVMVYTLEHLGELAARTGDSQKARIYYEESLSLIHQNNGNLSDTRWVLVKLGYTAIWQSDMVAAKNFFIQSLQHFKEMSEKIGIVYTLEGFASLATAHGQYERSAQFFAWADTMREMLFNTRPPAEQADVDRDLATIRANLDEATFAAAQEAGRAMSMDEAIALALDATHD